MTHFLSSRETQTFGTFHYPYAIVEHSMGFDDLAVLAQGLDKKSFLDALDDLEAPKEKIEAILQALKDPKETTASIDVAYRASSFLHETRHFYDQFGTYAGICLFANMIETLKDFYAAAARIKIEGSGWRWPDRKSIAEKGRSAEEQRLIRNVRAFCQGSELFLGAFKPLEIDGHIEEVFAEAITKSGHTIDVAPIRILAGHLHFESGLDAGHGGNGGALTAKTILYPLGIEVLFEANAHALTRSFIEPSFLKDLANSLTHDQMLVEYGGGEQPDLARQMLPYMVLDRQITKYLRANGKDKFERNAVLGIADEVLILSRFEIHRSESNTRMEISRVGKLIAEVLTHTPVDDLVAGNVPASDVVTQVYKVLLQSYEQGGDWDTVADDGSLLSSICIWESYTAQHFAVPLLRLRLATGHQVFRSSTGMSQLNQEVPPPIVAYDGKLQIDLPDRVRLAWAHVLMAWHLAHSIALRDTILCPRAFSAVPGLSNVSFSKKYDCDDYISVGCGKFDGVRVEETPCLFVDLLRSVALIE